MKTGIRYLFVVLVGSGFSFSTQAAVYDCSVAELSSSGTKELGVIKEVTPSNGTPAQKVEVNAEKDYVACEGAKDKKGDRHLLVCFFANADMQVMFKPSPIQGLPIAFGKRVGSRSLAALPLSGISDEAKGGFLALPVNEGQSLYIVACRGK